ncbi:hypothetical protein C8R45DRAFT_1087653 [Mycena sanguinolenta]|nr:hypothetical protein C8R45DRAFT_1087653 [Mycena sanguinolenta]
MAVRHSNIVQLYGTASFGDIHAAVFNDDLIPLDHFEDLYRHSHFSTVYIQAYIRLEFRTVHNYFWTTFGHYLWVDDCTFLIRPSTGRLCLDLVPGGRSLVRTFASMPALQGLDFLAGEDTEGAVIELLTLELYHIISYWDFSVIRSASISPSATVNLAGVYNCPSGNTSNDVVEVAWLPNTEVSSDHDWYVSGDGRNVRELMADGWTRLQSTDIVDTMAQVGFFTSDDGSWLSQANHIFTALQISSDLHHYVVLKEIYFTLAIPTIEGVIPAGFLFLCPSEDFRNAKGSFKWPDCPAYWSLDPSGAERLTLEEATNIGFPSFHLSTQICRRSWDASVYAGLRQFHQAKGFGPDSQDVARHLGHKLYEVSGPFAHRDDGDETSQYSTDAEFDDEPDSTPVNHGEYLVPASAQQDMAEVLISSSFETIMNSTTASTGSSLFSTNWDTSAAYGYGYVIQPNQYSATSDFSNFDPNFDAYNFGNDLSWVDDLSFNDAVPSISSLNYYPPMLHDGAQFFPATSLPQIPTSLLASSSFPTAAIVDAPMDLSWVDYLAFNDAVPWTSNLNYQPPMLPDAAQFFSLPQLPTTAPFFPSAPLVDTPIVASNLNYSPPMLPDAAQFTSLPQLPTSLPVASPFPMASVVDAPSTMSSSKYQPPMLGGASQLFPATSLPQLPTSLPAASSFPIAPSVDARAEGSKAL